MKYIFFILLLYSSAVFAVINEPNYPKAYFNFGTKLNKSAPLSWPRPVAFDGENLPKGTGNSIEGEKVYGIHCSSCHGLNLEGHKAFSAPTLIGGRGTLLTHKPMKTVESYWPYATTLFDYIRRSMPFGTPGILSVDEVYRVSAYILFKAKIIEKNTILNEKSLPLIKMPNSKNFIHAQR